MWGLGVAELLGDLRHLCRQGWLPTGGDSILRSKKCGLRWATPLIEVLGVQCRPEDQGSSLVAAMHPILLPVPHFSTSHWWGAQAIMKHEEQSIKELKTMAVLGKHLRAVKLRACLWLGCLFCIFECLPMSRESSRRLLQTLAEEKIMA